MDLTVACFLMHSFHTSYHQGRAFIDREPSTFSYVLDYLRNGGALPPLPKDDEQLLQRIREEFEYFCFIPNPVDDSRTWVEKFRDGEYTAELVKLRLPEKYRSFDSTVVGFGPRFQTPGLVTEGCDYGVLNLSIVQRQYFYHSRRIPIAALFSVSASPPLGKFTNLRILTRTSTRRLSLSAGTRWPSVSHPVKFASSTFAATSEPIPFRL